MLLTNKKQTNKNDAVSVNNPVNAFLLCLAWNRYPLFYTDDILISNDVI